MSSSQLHQVLMESGSCSQTEGQPPALPAKQHRSRSYRGSSADSDSVLHSPVGLQHLNYTFNDVFPESGDCNAALCPIHQGLAEDPLKHLVRFFSDGTPPPVPKKRLSRALSLPGNHGPPSSPMSSRPPLQMHPQNFDNPLYMLAPICDRHHSKESAEFGAVRSSPAPLLSLSQLSFDTPDEQLLNLFGSFDDQGAAVSKGIQHCHLLFLRSMAQNIEAKLLLQKEVSEKPVSSYQPQDFLLDEGSEPKRVAGTVYYSVHSSKFPGRTLALRVCKHTNEASSAHAKLQPLHPNVQTVVAHFQPITLKDSCTLPNLDSSLVSGKGCTAAKTPCGGSNEYANFLGSNLVSTVQHLLWKGHCVSIERDLPLATLEDFVQESTALQNTDCLLYDKQVCLLLLQILIGSQHLYNNSVSAPELIPREILLVWPNTERETNTKLKVNEQEDAEKKGQIHMLWKTLGSPRVVITSQTALSLPESFVYVKTQMRALIQYCLNAHKGLAPLYMSSYRKGMLYLASQLHRDSSSPHINDMVSTLQVILWGPSVPLFNPKHSVTSSVQNWLTIKRALLVMKLAEKGLIQDPSGLDWEDCLCLQYLSFTDPETVVSVTSQFQLSE